MFLFTSRVRVNRKIILNKCFLSRAEGVNRIPDIYLCMSTLVIKIPKILFKNNLIPMFGELSSMNLYNLKLLRQKDYPNFFLSLACLQKLQKKFIYVNFQLRIRLLRNLKISIKVLFSIYLTGFLRKPIEERHGQLVVYDKSLLFTKSLRFTKEYLYIL